MLQQTQVATVLGRGYFLRWLEKFPDVQSLAAASEDEVLKAWEGLGYYRRARNLQKAAAAVVEEHGGAFPRGLAEIHALPGVGRYTAGAVASFAFDAAAPVVDANVARVLARLFDFPVEVDSTAGQRQLWAWAEDLVPPAGARQFNSALMELGQKVCTPKSPSCMGCPVATFCRCTAPADLPKKKPKAATVFRDEFTVLAQRDGDVLLFREPSRRREGLWRLPERTAAETAGAPLLSRTRYGIMHHRVTLFVFAAPRGTGPREGESWHPESRLGELAMPSPYRRALDAVLRQDADSRPFQLRGEA
jgi:A/G-specific adenine glycosylase